MVTEASLNVIVSSRPALTTEKKKTVSNNSNNKYPIYMFWSFCYWNFLAVNSDSHSCKK